MIAEEMRVWYKTCFFSGRICLEKLRPISRRPGVVTRMIQLNSLKSKGPPDFDSLTVVLGVGEEELIEISTLNIPLRNYSLSGCTVELEVLSQAGKTVSVMVSSNQKILLDALRPGERFAQIDFCSPVAVFRSPCLVSGVSRLGSDPEKEVYVIHLTIQ